MDSQKFKRPFSLLAPLFKLDLCWHLGSLEMAALARLDANTESPQNAAPMCWTCLAAPCGGRPPWCIAPVSHWNSSATDWGGRWWMPPHVTDVSAPIHYTTHWTLPDTNVFRWRLIFLPYHLSLFFPSICQGPLDKQGKNIIQLQSCYERDKIEWVKQVTRLDASVVEFIPLNWLKDNQSAKSYQNSTHFALTETSLQRHRRALRH